MAFKFSSSVGRLVRARIYTPHLVDEIPLYRAAMEREAAAIGGKLMIITDGREAKIFPPEVAEGYISIMRRDNEHLERSALLVGTSSLFGMQVERMAAVVNNPSRRVFREVAECQAWLREVLTDIEAKALHEFLESGLKS